MTRSYNIGRRMVPAARTRAHILDAARDLLSGHRGISEFTVDAVAQAAGVARMTVYYQFGSKRGLVEALLDELTTRGLVDRLRATLTSAEPFEALASCIGAFVGFWASDRLVLRRLRSLAVLDPAIESTIRARDARRLDSIRLVLGRIAEQDGRPTGGALDDATGLLQALTSFETFDTLAETRTPEEVATILIRVAHAAVASA
jgi:AcrR family transcriptional regulator